MPKFYVEVRGNIPMGCTIEAENEAEAIACMRQNLFDAAEEAEFEVEAREESRAESGVTDGRD